MAKQTNSRTPIKLIVVAALVIFAGAGIYAWWQYSYTNPTKVFNRMIANNLATPSVTKSSFQQAGDQSLDQTSIIVTSPKQYVASQSTLTQGEGDQKSEVVTETLAFPTEEYTRYLSITTAQKNAQGKPFDFSKVLGMWGRTGAEDGVETFNQSLLGLMPVASLTPAQRKDLSGYIKNNDVFGINYGKVKKEWKNNRLAYTYEGSIKPIPYVTMLKKFAASVGLRQLQSVNPDDYKDSAPIAFTVDVDVISGQMTSVNYSGGERTDEFSAYGYRPVVNPPLDAVSINELQSRLQQIQ